MKQLEQKEFLFDWFGIPWINDHHTAPVFLLQILFITTAVVSYVLTPCEMRTFTKFYPYWRNVTDVQCRKKIYPANYLTCNSKFDQTTIFPGAHFFRSRLALSGNPIFFWKFSRHLIFSSWKQIFRKYLPKSKYFHKNGPFVSHVADDKFCLYCKFCKFRYNFCDIFHYFSYNYRKLAVFANIFVKNEDFHFNRTCWIVEFLRSQTRKYFFFYLVA